MPSIHRHLGSHILCRGSSLHPPLPLQDSAAFEKQLREAVAREEGLLARAQAAEQQLVDAERALQREQDLVSRLRQEAQAAVARAQQQVCWC